MDVFCLFRHKSVRKHFRSRFAQLFYMLQLPRMLYHLKWALFKTPEGDRLVYPPLGVIEDVHAHKVYERVFEPKKGFIVVDVGAHIGIYTLKVANIVGATGCVIAVEPESVNFRLLRFHVELNKKENVILVNKALSDQSGMTRLYLGRVSSSHSMQDKNATKKWIHVSVTTFDELMHEIGIEHVDFAKVDVEGAEISVLKGMNKILPDKLVLAAYHTADESMKIQRVARCKGYNTVEVVVQDSSYVYVWKGDTHGKNSCARIRIDQKSRGR